MKQRGFTLAEVMIALGILGLIGALTYGTFARAMDARDKATTITSHYHQIRQALQRMSSEISMAYLSEHRNCEDPRNETLFIAKSEGGGQRIDFTSFSHEKMRVDANESDQNELGYWVGNNAKNGNKPALVRREQAPIDDDAKEGGTEEVLAEDITALNFEFYNPKEDRWQDDWDTTNSEYKGRLPLFVKIEVKTHDPLTGKEETFVTKTRVFMKKSIHQMGFALCHD